LRPGKLWRIVLGAELSEPRPKWYQKGMKVLVTGASGFVGSTLCEELNRRGLDVHCLLRKTSSVVNLAQAKYQRVEGDLNSLDALARAMDGTEVIFHVAGAVAAKNREGFFEANSEGTKNLLQAAAKHGKSLKRFVLVSSLAAAGPSQPGRPNLETDDCHPVSDYGASKLSAEREVLAMGGDFPVSIIRPPAVYGPRDRGVFTFFQAVQKGILPLLGMQRPGSRRYSFVHVDDLVQGVALVGLSNSQRTKDIFYVSGDGEYSWEDAMRLIALGLEKQTVVVRLPLTLMKGAAAACSAYTKAFGKVLPFSLDKIKEIEAPAWTCSNQKAKSEIGFEPYWDLPKGLMQTARWYKENGWI
jgi:dihydroflavonol-4-reductase